MPSNVKENSYEREAWRRAVSIRLEKITEMPDAMNVCSGQRAFVASYTALDSNGNELFSFRQQIFPPSSDPRNYYMEELTKVSAKLMFLYNEPTDASTLLQRLIEERNAAIFGERLDEKTFRHNGKLFHFAPNPSYRWIDEDTVLDVKSVEGRYGKISFEEKIPRTVEPMDKKEIAKILEGRIEEDVNNAYKFMEGDQRDSREREITAQRVEKNKKVLVGSKVIRKMPDEEIKNKE